MWVVALDMDFGSGIGSILGSDLDPDIGPGLGSERVLFYIADQRFPG